MAKKISPLAIKNIAIEKNLESERILRPIEWWVSDMQPAKSRLYVKIEYLLHCGAGGQKGKKDSYEIFYDPEEFAPVLNYALGLNPLERARGVALMSKRLNKEAGDLHFDLCDRLDKSTIKDRMDRYLDIERYLFGEKLPSLRECVRMEALLKIVAEHEIAWSDEAREIVSRAKKFSHSRLQEAAG